MSQNFQTVEGGKKNIKKVALQNILVDVNECSIKCSPLSRLRKAYDLFGSSFSDCPFCFLGFLISSSIPVQRHFSLKSKG